MMFGHDECMEKVSSMKRKGLAFSEIIPTHYCGDACSFIIKPNILKRIAGASDTNRVILSKEKC